MHNRDRKLTVICVSCFTLAALMVIARFTSPGLPPALSLANASGVALPLEMSPELQKIRLERNIETAKSLRSKWSHWAEGHKAMLQRMKVPGNVSFQEMYATLPAVPENAGGGFTHNDPSSGFAWNCGIGQVKWSGLESQKKEWQEGNESVLRYYESVYAKNNDFFISCSGSVGPTQVYLWASGRITVATDKVIPYHGGTTIVEGEHREIAPPFY